MVSIEWLGERWVEEAGFEGPAEDGGGSLVVWWLLLDVAEEFSPPPPCPSSSTGVEVSSLGCDDIGVVGMQQQQQCNAGGNFECRGLGCTLSIPFVLQQ